MPLDYINALYNIAIERQKEDMKRREEAKEKGETPMAHFEMTVTAEKTDNHSSFIVRRNKGVR